MSKRYEEAWKVAKKAAVLLKKSYGAKKVAVFGSLVHRSQFTPWSDVDIAVWGIPDNLYYAAVGAVTGLSKEIKVEEELSEMSTPQPRAGWMGACNTNK